MTHIDFHVLTTQGRRQHDVYVCQLVQQAYRDGRRVHIHCLDEDMVTALDDLLWTFSDTSFVPHAPAGSADAAAAPVLLAASLAAPATADLLINLHVEVPPFFSQFEQVVETTGEDERAKALARARYKFYKDRGYPIATVDA
ncbi:MAG TPA: DNA polymerase III subunit chi [Gammaproteobacteria bacterium]|nr:DNA polymerase III subunit chi [Gammaproteobacteria bacterium]